MRLFAFAVMSLAAWMSAAGPPQGANCAPPGGSAAAAAASVGVQFASVSGSAGVRAVDDTGATVELPAPAQRIVSLAPHATELLFAAGAGARIVGVMSGSDYPAAAAALPVVGTSSALDLERILLLRPDLIVTWPYTTPAQVELLRSHGIPVFTTNPRTMAGIALDLERLGALAGTADLAHAAATRFRERLTALQQRARGRAPVRVFYEVSDTPLYTIGGGHLITQALDACGAQNVFAALSIPAPEVSVEAVLAARPDAIIAGTGGARRPRWLDDWRRWPDLPAARAGRLYTVDANLLHRAGPRFAEGVAQLCDIVEQARGIAVNANGGRTPAGL
jgi:iron complex transport system substrate-binding protein